MKERLIYFVNESLVPLLKKSLHTVYVRARMCVCVCACVKVRRRQATEGKQTSMLRAQAGCTTAATHAHVPEFTQTDDTTWLNA